MKNTMFSELGDIFCPQRCLSCGKTDKILCDCCKKNLLKAKADSCLVCGRQLNMQGICPNCDLPFSRQCHVGVRGGVLKDLINCYKYQSIRSISFSLADLLSVRIMNWGLSDAVLVPLPTIAKHIRERGFDHIQRLALCMAKQNINYAVEPLLSRANNCVQVGASEEVRASQAKTAYVMTNLGFARGKNYILLDDV